MLESRVITKTFRFVEEIEYKTNSNGSLLLNESDLFCRIEKSKTSFNILTTKMPKTKEDIIVNVSESTYREFLEAGVIEQVSSSEDSIH